MAGVLGALWGPVPCVCSLAWVSPHSVHKGCRPAPPIPHSFTAAITVTGVIPTRETDPPEGPFFNFYFILEYS